MKKVIIVASVILVIVIILFIIISRALLSGGSAGQPTPTPVPLINLSGTSRSPVTGIFEEGTTLSKEQIDKLYPTLTQQQVQKELDQFKKEAHATLSTEQKNNLKKLQNKLKEPVKTDEFEMIYFPDLDLFVVNIKRAEGYQRFEDFLKENNVLDVYQQGHGVIVVENNPDRPVEDLAKGLKNDMEGEARNLGPHDDYVDTPPVQTSTNQVPPPSESNRDIEYLSNFMKIITDFDLNDLGEGVQTTEKDNSLPVPASTSTSSIQGLVYPPNLGSSNGLGYFQMPTSPSGEYVFNSNANAGTCLAQRYGSKTLIGVIYTTALNWKQKHPEARLRVGDLNASGRSIEHKNGIDVDLTEWASGKKGPAFNMAGYNNSTMRARSIELGKLLIDTKLIHHMWYNDATVRQELVSYAHNNRLPLSHIRHLSGHEDHVHVNINSPKGPRHEPSC